MAISVVQRKTATDNGGAGGSIAAAFGSNVTAGNAIIVVASMSDSTQALFNKELRPPTDTQGNKYYLVQNAGYDSTALIGMRVYVAYNITGGANTVTLADNNNEGQVVCYEVSGLATYAAFDKSAAAVQASTTSYDSGNTASISYANELLIGAFTALLARTSFNAGTGYSNIQNQAGSSDILATEEQIVSSAAAYNATATATGSAGTGIAGITTFADTALTNKVVGITHAATTMNTTSGTHAPSATPAVNDLIVIVACNTGKATTTTPTDNNSDGLGTYTLITSALKSTSADILEIYVRNALIGSATSTTFTQAPGTTTGGGVAVYRISGMTKTGATAVKQSAKQDNQAANGTPAPTFAAGVTSPNPVISAVFNTTNSTVVGTHQPLGFVRGQHNAYATPATSLFSCFSEGGRTGTAMTYDAQSQSAFCSVAVEFDSSGNTSTVKQLAALGVG